MDNHKPSRWRFEIFFALLGAALLALAWRVVDLQAGWGAGLARIAQRQQRTVIHLPARPGNVFARTRGGYTLLASSRQVPSIYADPLLLGEDQLAPTARKVAAAVGADPAELFGTMYGRRFQQFAYLVRAVTDQQAEAVRRLKIPGVQVTYEWRREYPMGPLGVHALGFRRGDGLAGAGIELAADRWLKARQGLKVARCDAARRGTYAAVEEYRPPRDGQHVLLTLDVVVQRFLEEALASAAEEFGAAAAMGVVMDPNTGELLAIGSVPTYDPNQYEAATPAQHRNRAVTDPYEPGSAFKPFIAAGAVQMEKAELHTTFFCHHGLYNSDGGGTIRDFPGERFGTIPLSEIVIHSSNIGMAKLGEHLGDRSLYTIAWAFGFGRRTGVDLPGESPGRLVPTRQWSPYATRRLPFGQGPIMVTALQLANAFCAIANGGELLRPRIVDRVIDADGNVIYRARRQRVHRVLSQRVCREFMDQVLVNVVERGTGKRCRLKSWQVFGKTGTGQIGGPDGYEDQAYTATFMAGAPVGRPAVVCVISVYRPVYSRGYTGGRVAAPAVREVLAKTLAYLDVPPEKFQSVVSRPVDRPGT